MADRLNFDGCAGPSATIRFRRLRNRRNHAETAAQPPATAPQPPALLRPQPPQPASIRSGCTVAPLRSRKAGALERARPWSQKEDVDCHRSLYLSRSTRPPVPSSTARQADKVDCARATRGMHPLALLGGIARGETRGARSERGRRGHLKRSVGQRGSDAGERNHFGRCLRASGAANAPAGSAARPDRALSVERLSILQRGSSTARTTRAHVLRRRFFKNLSLLAPGTAYAAAS
jgi:hypothetical protein